MGSPDEADEVATRVGGRGRSARVNALRWFVSLVVLAGAALFVVERLGSSLGLVAVSFEHLRWHWLFVSLGAEAVSMSALSWLQGRLLSEGGAPAGLVALLPVTMASNAVAQSLPAGALFAEGYAYRQYRRLGASPALGAWAELSAGALATAALACVAVLGAVVAGPGLRLELLPALGVVLAGALLASALLRRAPLLSSLLGKVLRASEDHLPESLCWRIQRAEAATAKMAGFSPSIGLWAACLGAAALNWGMDAAVLVTGLLSVGGPVPWRGVLLVYAGAQVLAVLPLTPGGLGLVEGGLVELLTRFHVPVSRATAATLVYRAVSYWLLVLVGWCAVLWLTIRARRAASVAAG